MPIKAFVKEAKALLCVTVEGQLTRLLLSKFLEPRQRDDFPERDVNGLTS